MMPESAANGEMGGQNPVFRQDRKLLKCGKIPPRLTVDPGPRNL
jgi:hypothetical protein